MKKNILIILLLLICNTVLSQTNSQEDISLSPDKLTQIIFKENVEKLKGGFNPNEFSIEIYNNILFIQPLAGDIKASNLSVVTKDGLIYMLNIKIISTTSEYSYIIEETKAINYNKSTTNKTKNIEPTQVKNSKDSILSSKGYITSLNGIVKYNIGLFITGIYADTNFIYVRVKTDNNSNIEYNISAITFTVENIKKSKVSSIDSNQLHPTNIYASKKTIPIKASNEMLFEFSKTTINNEKVIRVNLIEENGERNLSFDINHKMLKKTLAI